MSSALRAARTGSAAAASNQASPIAAARSCAPASSAAVHGGAASGPPSSSGDSMNSARAPRPHPLTSHVYRDIARFAGEALAAGLIVSLALALAIFIVATQAQAAETGPGQGTLLLKPASDGVPVAAPLLFTHVDIAVSGATARTTVTQRFANPTALWREGVYVFPLPEKAAVDHLAMEIGAR